ncbi:MAG: L7Ae/L30e/S12e/Gadd45 family ribosomal protein [Bacillota bacterium]
MISPALHSMLGLCQRAGKLVSGDFAVEQALRRGKADLLLLAEDASERTREKFLKLAEQAGTRCFSVGDRADFGSALGKADRAVVAIQSRDFTKGIIGILQREGLTPVSGRG